MPRGGCKGTLLHLLQRLAAFEPQHGTSVGPALHDLARQLRRKGIVILISDLLDDEQRILSGLQHLRFGGHEVVVFHTLDAYELEFPFTGLVEFEGLEEASKVLTRPGELRKSYLQELENFRRRLREGCERNQCHYVLANTGHAMHEVLSGYLAFRKRTTIR